MAAKPTGSVQILSQFWEDLDGNVWQNHGGVNGFEKVYMASQVDEIAALKASIGYVDEQITDTIEYVNQGDGINAANIIAETDRAIAVENTKANAVDIFTPIAITFAELSTSTTYTNLLFANQWVHIDYQNPTTPLSVRAQFNSSGILTLPFTAVSGFAATLFGVSGALGNYLPKTSVINNLTTGGVAVPLSAEQGKVLGDQLFTRSIVEGKTTSLETYTLLSVNNFRGFPSVLSDGELASLNFNCVRIGDIRFSILSKNLDGTYKLEDFFICTLSSLGITTLISGTHFPTGIIVRKDYVIGFNGSAISGYVGYKPTSENTFNFSGIPSGDSITLGVSTTVSFGVNFTISTGIIEKRITRTETDIDLAFVEIDAVEALANIGVGADLKIDDVSEIVHSTNYIDKSLIVLDSYYNNANGVINASVGRGRTAKIDVVAGEEWTVNGGKSDYCFVVYWKFDGSFLSSSNITSGIDTTFTIPVNAVKAALNFANANADTYVDTLQLNKGTEVLPYEEFYIRRQIKEEAIPSSGGGGLAYDQSLNTFDSVEFASLRIGGVELDLPTSPVGLSAGRAWVDIANGNVIKVVI